MADLFDRYGAPEAAQPPKGGDLFDRYAPQSAGVQDYEPQGYTNGQKAARIVGQGAQGFNDAVAGTIGTPVDLVSKGLKAIGVPVGNAPVGGSESIKKGMDYVATLPGRVGDAVSQGSLAPIMDDRTSRFDPVNQTEKIARGAGEGVGNALSIALPAAAIARGAQAGTLTQGVANVLASQPVTQAVAGAVGGGVTAATDNPWLGLAAGAAVPVAAAIGRGVISPVTNRLNAQEQNLVAAAGREGIPLTPAQRTGSPTLKTMEGTFNSMPLASGPMQDTFNGQRQQFNRAVLERAGVTATDATPDTVQRAFQAAGQTFDDLARRTVVNVDNQFVGDVQRVATDYGRRLETDVAPVFRSYLDDLTPLMQAAQTPGANPQIAGEIYGRIRSDIAVTMRETKSAPLRRALGGLVEAFDDAMERSTTGALRAEWQDARSQYQALMTVDKAMQGGTQASRSSGDIAFNALKGAVQQGDRSGYSRGRGQLNELSRVGDFLSNKVPDSGTVPRGMLANPLNWPALAVGGVMSRAYNSRLGNAYLTNQVAGNTNFNALYGSQAGQGVINGGAGVPNALRLLGVSP